MFSLYSFSFSPSNQPVDELSTCEGFQYMFLFVSPYWDLNLQPLGIFGSLYRDSNLQPPGFIFFHHTEIRTFNPWIYLVHHTRIFLQHRIYGFHPGSRLGEIERISYNCQKANSQKYKRKQREEIFNEKQRGDYCQGWLPGCP